MNKRCKEKSIFESITEVGDVRTEINNLDCVIDDKIGCKTVLNILNDCASSHLSINSLLNIIFKNDEDCKYYNFTSEGKDLVFYTYIVNRIFLPSIRTDKSINC